MVLCYQQKTFADISNFCPWGSRKCIQLKNMHACNQCDWDLYITMQLCSPSPIQSWLQHFTSIHSNMDPLRGALCEIDLIVLFVTPSQVTKAHLHGTISVAKCSSQQLALHPISFPSLYCFELQVCDFKTIDIRVVEVFCYLCHN